MKESRKALANLVMLGPPGAGKGTQAKQWASDQGVPHVSTGEILREAVKSLTPIGIEAKAILEAGSLVSDRTAISIVRERLDQPDTKLGFVLDGFPRTVRQAVALDEITKSRGPLVVLEFVVPDEEVVRRLSRRRVCGECGTNYGEGKGELPSRCTQCGSELVLRSDDCEDIVRKRLAVYHRLTQPLVDFYAGRPTFGLIDGSQPLATVRATVMDTVAKCRRGEPLRTGSSAS